MVPERRVCFRYALLILCHVSKMNMYPLAISIYIRRFARQMLAGRTSTSSTLQTQGNIFLGGVKINPRDREVQRRFGYISQQDELHQSSTPRECLAFAAKLRLPRTWTQTQIDELVSTMIIELGLTQCCDQQIGGTFKRGISGGETRRVSIGVELIARPSIIFADEPTSGLGKIEILYIRRCMLTIEGRGSRIYTHQDHYAVSDDSSLPNIDSFAATKIMKLLDRLARAGNTVLFTIVSSSPLNEIFDFVFNSPRIIYCSFSHLLTVFVCQSINHLQTYFPLLIDSYYFGE